MKSLFFVNHPELFQGEKKLINNSDYFEGWYFKIVSSSNNIAFIPGINIENGEASAFIQIIINTKSYFIKYSISDFEFTHNPFYIKIGENIFSPSVIKININDAEENLHLSGEFFFSDSVNLKPSKYAPYIMGPFSYLSSMECNHHVISMKNFVNGFLNYNTEEFIFQNSIGYIEKDWGCSFPKNYMWAQANSFSNKNSSFFISIANIPFCKTNFRGLISGLIVDGTEYKFTTYYGSKILHYEVTPNSFNIILKNNKITLEVTSNINNNTKLVAPVKGKMNKDILESISSNISLTLKENNNILFADTSNNCGLEVVV